MTYLKASSAGIVNMMSSVSRGDSPTCIRPVYVTAPNIPAAPVPAAQLEIVWLYER